MNEAILAAHITKMMEWHFSDSTGCPFWLNMRDKLTFNPLKNINTFADLSLFPDISLQLRDVRVEDLIPRGLNSTDIVGVFESGATTGSPKRYIVYEEWLQQLTKWRTEDLQHNLKANKTFKNTLAAIPSGPHLVSAINSRRTKALGGLYFTVDLDPRWVKKLIKAGDMQAVKAYTNHIVDQMEPIIFSQSIDNLVATPQLLVAISQRKNLASYLNDTLNLIMWGGTHMDVDTLDYLKTSVFNNVTITASYGSSMILSETKARFDQEHNGSPIFDSFLPYVILEVMDPVSKKPVDYYKRGQVCMNHLSKFALFPNILERDTAIRLPARNHEVGAAVSDVSTMAEVSGQVVIEGVY